MDTSSPNAVTLLFAPEDAELVEMFHKALANLPSPPAVVGPRQRAERALVLTATESDVIDARAQLSEVPDMPVFALLTGSHLRPTQIPPSWTILPHDQIPLRRKGRLRRELDVLTAAMIAAGDADFQPELQRPSDAIPTNHLAQDHFSPAVQELFDTTLRVATLFGDSGAATVDHLLFGIAECGRNAGRRKTSSRLVVEGLRKTTPYEESRHILMGDPRADELPRVEKVAFVHRELVQILEDAGKLAHETMSRNSAVTIISARHVVAAAFLRHRIDPYHPLGKLDFRALRQMLLKRVIANVGGDKTTWERILGDDPQPAASHSQQPADRGPASARGAGSSDQPRDRDGGLGFDPYVLAVTEFLTSKDTEGPLTMAIEGAWGSGKSSFMLQVQRSIREGDGAKPRDARHVCVWFNAWRHDKQEALWASFALELLDSVRRSRTWGRRVVGNLKLLWLRYSWQNGWLDAVRAAGLLLLFILFTAWLPLLLRKVDWIAAWGGTLPDDRLVKLLTIHGTPFAVSLVAILTLWREVLKFVGNPFARDLKKHLQSPDYDTNVAFVERFHADFANILRAYVGPARRVFVFVDDLDRCAIPKAAELMQAINLLVTTASNVIFVVGIDREKIAASLAAKYKDVIPYLVDGATGKGDIDPQQALAYGRSCLEKFIQVSFSIPQPKADDVKRFLTSLAQRRTPEAETRPLRAWMSSCLRSARSWWERPIGQAPIAVEAPPPPDGEVATPAVEDRRRPTITTRQELERVATVVSSDSTRLQDIAAAMAKYFDYNPRRLTQFMNIMRLRTFVAATTGRLITGTGARELTLEKLGKFVALEMLYPRLCQDVADERTLLRDLQQLAINRTIDDKATALVRQWNQKTLLDVLSIGTAAAAIDELYDLSGVSVEDLIEI